MRLACQYHRKLCKNIIRNWRRWMRDPYGIEERDEDDSVPPCGDNVTLEVFYGPEPM